jgi:hypothetical protein
MFHPSQLIDAEKHLPHLIPAIIGCCYTDGLFWPSPFWRTNVTSIDLEILEGEFHVPNWVT